MADALDGTRDLRARLPQAKSKERRAMEVLGITKRDVETLSLAQQCLEGQARLCARLKERGPARARQVKLRELIDNNWLPEGADEKDAVAASERLIMMQNLEAILDFVVLDTPGIPAEYGATLLRIWEGLLSVQSGRNFHAFQPTKGDGRGGGSDLIFTVMTRRAAVAAAIEALIDSKEFADRAAVLKHAQNLLAECVPTDFGCPAHKPIEASTIGNWQYAFSREGGSGCVPADERYRAYCQNSQRAVKMGAPFLSDYANRLLRAVVG